MKFLRRFHDIVSDQNLDFDEKIDQLLYFGLEVFKLDLAIISKVVENTYTVLHAITPDDSLVAGTQFDLTGTYCIHTLKANKALAFYHAGNSTIAEHPCYKNFQLESYIGAPIKVGDTIFGTVNFSSAKISSPFKEDTYDYIELFAQWLGNEFARSHAKKKLVLHSKTLKKLENMANIGTWEADLINSKIYWSEQTRRIHQASEDFSPTIEQAIEFYKEGHSRDCINQAVTAATEHGEKWHLELEVVTAKNNHIWVSSFGEAEFKNGQCIRLFGTFQNITESVELRQALTKKKLEAERMLEDRSMLLAKISHELRTPLNGITGMLTTLIDERSEEKRTDKIKIALRSADILLNTINEVLDFSKINHGEFKLEPNNFLLKTIFTDLASLYTPLFKDTDISFNVHNFIDDDCWVICDNTRLSQIVSNLLSNALKFTEQGHVMFSTSVTTHQAGLLLNITVSDTGRGMSDAFLQSLFAPFTQEVDAKNNKGGTGLGLAIVKELIDYMQGTIKVTSKPNKGSQFEVSLPIKIGKAEAIISTNRATIDGSNLKVLVVDDNQINRLVLHASLEKLKISADFAVDGEDAILKCQQKHYDLIFMDCVMPILDGFSATKQLREKNICPFKSTYIVALTANTSAQDKLASVEAGMDMFIAKPFKLPTIEKAVHSTQQRLKAMTV
ncbi:response regulator [Pseudoalteromonas sp. MMG010]|uniref:hybrid sensor histidine kinase/response regulator n=1 Tax=Pseudoalteromonas sp. MMG010 TaxID=2822685 RepID=UPI001B3A5B68|nr:ATP-binding protein [Pseudoalteromonas sp. MMG010]MBQ4833770.1 response regulator [Pseudoalteromonas sp. MMG010]